MTDTQQIPQGRLILGVSILVIGFMSPLLIPLVTGTSWSVGVKTTASGLLAFGVPEVFMLIAIAVMGKQGYEYIKGKAFKYLKRFAPPDTVTLTRYRIGLIMVSLPLLVGWLQPYLGHYFTFLKNLPVFDVFCIASGFVFRLFAGGAAFGVDVSDWLFLSVLLLAIFLSSGKRLSEKMMLGTLSGVHRKALKEYPAGALEGFMYVSGSAVLVTYTMYAITMHRLVFTVPLCCFGLFRYVLIVKRGESGDPTDSLIKDPVMFMVGLLWVLHVGLATYFNV